MGPGGQGFCRGGAIRSPVFESGTLSDCSFLAPLYWTQRYTHPSSSLPVFRSLLFGIRVRTPRSTLVGSIHITPHSRFPSQKVPRIIPCAVSCYPAFISKQTLDLYRSHSLPFITRTKNPHRFSLIDVNFFKNGAYKPLAIHAS